MKKLFAILCIPFLLGAKSENYQPIAPCYKADIIFVIDYSGSMSSSIPYYQTWLQTTVRELPLSINLKAGFLLFSDNVCPTMCPLTEDLFLLEEKIPELRNCPSCGTYLEEALKKSKELFDESEKERNEKVSKILVLVTDLDVSDPVESCEIIYSEMSDIFFVLIDPDSVRGMQRVDDLKNCILHNGIYFNGLVPVYQDLLKLFDPCM